MKQANQDRGTLLLALIAALILLRIKPGQPFPFGPYPIIAAIGWVILYR